MFQGFSRKKHASFPLRKERRIRRSVPNAFMGSVLVGIKIVGLHEAALLSGVLLGPRVGSLHRAPTGPVGAALVLPGLFGSGRSLLGKRLGGGSGPILPGKGIPLLAALLRGLVPPRLLLPGCSGRVDPGRELCLACIDRRMAGSLSLRLRQDPVPLHGPWAFAFASVQAPLCAFPRASL